MKSRLVFVGRLIARHRVVSAGVVLAAGLVAALFIVRPWSVVSYQMPGGGVWVANGSAVSRVDVQVHQQDVKQQPVDHPILVQDGSIAVLLTSGKLYPLDPASASEGAATSVDPKADAGSVAVGGGVVAVVGPGGAGETIRTGFSTGRTLHLDGPTYDVGGGSTVAAGSDGTVASYSPLTSQLTRLAPGSTEPTTSATDAGQAPQITVNNGRGVLLSSGSPRRLLIDDGHQDVDVGSVGSRVVLQQMNLSHGPIALASEQGLFLVSTSGAMTTLWRSGSSAGAPVRPLVGVDGCVYGAWRGADPFEVMVCPGSSPVVRTLQAAKGWGTGGGSYQPGPLTFQAGSLGPALNDLASGDSFVMLDDNLFVVPWDQGSISNQTTPDRVLTPRNPQADHSIVATPDSLSARSGKVAQLAVLVNDYDAAGDVLSVESVTASNPGQQQLFHVTQGDSVALDLSSAPIAVGQSLSFTYTVSNGRGQTASAPVTVKIVSSTDYTEAPVRRDSLQEPVLPARQGTIVRYDVVNDWYDPAGGPLFIKQATAVDGSDAVTWSPEGWLEIGPISGSTTAVNVVVANAGGTNSSYTVRLHLVSSADHPVAADDLAYGTVGEAMLLQPLHNDFSASGAPLELVASPQPLDQGSAPELSLKNDGTLMVTPAKVGSYTYLYQAKDSQTQETSAQAYLRLVVTGAGAPPDAPAQSVQIPNLGGVTVDLLTAASNPNQGEPLVVTGFSVANSCPPGSGCTGVVGVIEQNRWLHLTDLGGPQGHAALVSYQVSNSNGSTASMVEVFRETEPLGPAIVARPMSVVVSPGQVGTAPVLSNCWSSLGASLAIISVGQPSSGSAWIDGVTIRFLADVPQGAVTVPFTVSDGQGSTATSTATFTVTGTKTAPLAPEDLDVRAIAGSAVRIAVPLERRSDGTAVNPNGAHVSLVGPSSQPTSGTVTKKGDFLVYQAPEVPGPDHFSYQITDTFGNAATGAVTIAVVAPPTGANLLPAAGPDVFHVRLGAQSALLPVLENDAGLNGGALRVDGASLQHPSDVGASVSQDGEVIVVGPIPSDCPVRWLDGSCRWVLSYQARNSVGPSATTQVTLIGDGKGEPPTASDFVVTSLKSPGTADVLATATNPGGSSRSLAVSLVNPTSGDHVADGVVTFVLGANPRTLVYQVNDSDSGLSARAAIWIPGRGSNVPTLVEPTPLFEAKIGTTKSIDLGPVIKVPNGDDWHFVGQAPSSSNPLGAQFETGSHTVAVTPSAVALGRQTLFVEVSGAAPHSERSLAIPFQVLAHDNSPPKWSAGIEVHVYSGEATPLYLNEYASDPDPTDQGRLRFSLPRSQVGDLALTLTGSTMTVDAGNQTGTTKVPVEVTDRAGASAQTAVSVVVDKLPVSISTVPGVGRVKVGESLTTDLTPLITVSSTKAQTNTRYSVVLAPGGNLPGGITAEVTGRNLTVRAASDALALRGKTVSIGYIVRSADANTSQAGYLSVTVEGPPDQPPAPTAKVDAKTPSRAEVIVAAPQVIPHLPVLSYRVTASPGGQSCTVKADESSACTVTGLTNGTSYTFTEVATNAAGTSPPSPASSPVKPIDVPGPPTITSVNEDDSQVTVSWSAPSDSGAPITAYTVTSDPGSMTCQTPTLSCTVSGLSNGTAYSFKVAATNDAGTGGPSAPSSPKTPRGKPLPPSPSVKKTTSSSISISWEPVDGNGSNVKYYTVITKPGDATKRVDVPSFDFATTDSSTAFSFVVTATNEAGLEGDQGSTPAVRATDGPQPPSNLRATPNGDGSVKIVWEAPQPSSLANNQNITGYTVTASPGGRTCTAEAQVTDCTIDGLTNGTSYSFVAVAQSSSGSSPESASLPATPIGAPEQPALDPVAAGDSQITLSWSAGADGGSPIASYIIEIQSAGVPWSPVLDTDLIRGSTTSTTCTVTGLTNGTEYSFRVTATNAAGAKSPSSDPRAATPTALPPP